MQEGTFAKSLIFAPMSKPAAIIAAIILFLLPAFEIGRWIYVAETSEKFSEAKARFNAPYPQALQNNNISTWIFFLSLGAAAVIFFANWKRGLFFRIMALLSSLLAFWMLFSLM